MSRIKSIELFKYEELSDDAKAKARDWYRNTNADADDTYWSGSVIGDFDTLATACGFTLETIRGRSTAQKAIYWSGFWSQGDGASFSASWRASDVDVAALLIDRPATYKDAHGATCTDRGNKELAEVLNAAKALADADLDGYGSTSASYRGHYQTDTEYDSDCGEDKYPIDPRVDAFEELCRDLAHWLYRSLEREYEYKQSDDVVAENIMANEYEFTEDGAIG